MADLMSKSLATELKAIRLLLETTLKERKEGEEAKLEREAAGILTQVHM